MISLSLKLLFCELSPPMGQHLFHNLEVNNEVSRAWRHTAASTCSLALLIFAPPAFANSADDTMSEILKANPGVSKSEMEAALGIEGLSQNEQEATLSKVALEVRRNQASSNKTSMVASSSGGGGTVRLGNARSQGDIYWAPAGPGFAAWNHVGLYYNTTTTIEAPGTGQLTRKFVAKDRMVGKGAQKKFIKDLSESRRLAAANWAGKHLDKEYNYNFAANRVVESTRYNCSQFVWAAVYSVTNGGFDLDRDGGAGVYPDDVSNASQTRWYETV